MNNPEYEKEKTEAEQLQAQHLQAASTLKQQANGRYPRTYEIDPDGNQSFYRYGDRNGSGSVDIADSNYKTAPGYDYRDDGER